MPRLPSLLTRLTVETASLREHVDAALFGPLEVATVASYRRLLCQLYGFHAPLEAALRATACIDAAFVWARQKAPYLATDLLALGLAGDDYPLLVSRHDIPAFRATAEAVGWLYVTERLTLRHPMLRGQLAVAIPDALERADLYIRSYEGETHARWRELGAMLEVIAWSEDNADRVVASARAGLRSLLGYLTLRAPAVPVPDRGSRHESPIASAS